MDPGELVINKRTGEVRQAGATQSGRFIAEFKRRAEGSLFLFGKGVLGLTRLTRPLHVDVCRFLQTSPPYRKLLLLPRDHLKTSICARTLPLHTIIQPQEFNIYRPHTPGRDVRVLLGNETIDLAQKQLGWIKGQLEGNEILRALWPHCVWNNARRDSRQWNENGIIVPRTQDYPEPTIQCTGVGTAVTGRHFNVHIFDDLVTFEASRSEVEMQKAVDWFLASRALMDDPDTDLEFTLGTRWAVWDLYQHIIDNDPSVEHVIRSAIEDGEPIYPRQKDPTGKWHGFNQDILDQLRSEMQERFYLMYMNSPDVPELTDLRMEDIRYYKMQGDKIVFEDDARDLYLAEPEPAKEETTNTELRGMRLNRDTYDIMKSRLPHIRRAVS